jgi:hypothetical protein
MKRVLTMVGVPALIAAVVAHRSGAVNTTLRAGGILARMIAVIGLAQRVVPLTAYRLRTARAERNEMVAGRNPASRRQTPSATI